jgi:precorrin-2 dehydrogenase/sirohydrochlorin ferrochelatase
MTKKLLPVALDLSGRACLVVGAGGELEARACSLAELGAVVSIVSAKPSTALEALARERGLKLVPRAFDESDLDGIWLVVIASDDANEVDAVSRAAEARRIHYCAVDRPTRGSFSHMALARAGSLVIAVSTAGAAPALSRRLRQELERLLGESNMERFVDLLAELRGRTPPGSRRELLGRAVDGLCFTGRLELPELGQSG